MLSKTERDAIKENEQFVKGKKERTNVTQERKWHEINRKGTFYNLGKQQVSKTEEVVTVSYTTERKGKMKV